MALAQTEEIARRLTAADPDLDVEIVKFETSGDSDQTGKLLQHGGKGGAFVAEIRAAVVSGELHAAMHSLKDMPGNEDTPGLVIGATLARDPPGDALVLRWDRDRAVIRESRLLDDDDQRPPDTGRRSVLARNPQAAEGRRRALVTDGERHRRARSEMTEVRGSLPAGPQVMDGERQHEQIDRLLLHASDDGRSVYERLGFTPQRNAFRRRFLILPS